MFPPGGQDWFSSPSIVCSSASSLFRCSATTRPPAHNIRPPNLFAINNGAGSVPFVLCFYCFNYLFFVTCFIYSMLFYIAPTPEAYNILRTNTLWSSKRPNTFHLFLFVLTFCQIENFYLSKSWSTISNWSKVCRKRWNVLLEMR